MARTPPAQHTQCAISEHFLTNSACITRNPERGVNYTKHSVPVELGLPPLHTILWGSALVTLTTWWRLIPLTREPPIQRNSTRTRRVESPQQSPESPQQSLQQSLLTSEKWVPLIRDSTQSPRTGIHSEDRKLVPNELGHHLSPIPIWTNPSIRFFPRADYHVSNSDVNKPR